MKKVFSGILIFGVVLVGSQCQYVKASQKNGREVPKDFSYPESPSTTRVEVPMFAKSLSGFVAAPSGSKIPKALVEIVSEDWKTRLGAIFTDSEGSFLSARAPIGKHYLKISMPGFDTLLITVITTKRSHARLKLFLNPST